MKPKVLIVGTDPEGAPDWLEEFKSTLEADFIDDKPNATHIVYIFTPENFGMVAAVDVVNDSRDRAKKMIVCIHDPETKLTELSTEHLFHACQTVYENGALWLPSLEEVAMYVNLKTDPKKKIKLKKESDTKRKEVDEAFVNDYLAAIAEKNQEIHELQNQVLNLEAEIEALKPVEKKPVEE